MRFTKRLWSNGSGKKRVLIAIQIELPATAAGLVSRRTIKGDWAAAAGKAATCDLVHLEDEHKKNG